jgi:hypothetical protein
MATDVTDGSYDLLVVKKVINKARLRADIQLSERDEGNNIMIS